jgi:hypothetical protein
MHKNAPKCNETLNKWCKNKHGASKIMDMLETYQRTWPQNTRTERSSMSHMDDMINMLMFTIKATSSHVMIGLGVVNLDHASLNNFEGC